MTDKFNMDRLSENDESTSADQQVGSFRTNSFFELYNNQNYIKNDLNNRKQSNSFNRSEEDEENLDCNLDDLNFDDLDDYGLKERNEFRSKVEIISDEDDEELDKFDEEENNENHLNDRLSRSNFNNGIPISQRFNKNRSNSIRIDEEGSRTKDDKISHSLPVTIPYNHKTFNSTNIRNRHHKNQRDKDENWFSVKEKGENIAESIKQLANSVRDDDYSLFGDLPSRKFNTSELIHSFK